MPKSTYTDQLRKRLDAIERDIARARRKLEDGKFENRLSALNELANLETKQKAMTQKLEEAISRHAEKWSAFKSGLQQDIDGLEDTVESWIMKNT